MVEASSKLAGAAHRETEGMHHVNPSCVNIRHRITLLRYCQHAIKIADAIVEGGLTLYPRVAVASSTRGQTSAPSVAIATASAERVSPCAAAVRDRRRPAPR
jgi:hypothetical protein